MIKILNANRVGEIASYCNYNQYSIFGYERVNYMIQNEKEKFRALIFNQYILPIADVENDKIKKLIIYDVRFLSSESRNIVVFAGSIDQKFIMDSVNLINLLYKKIIIKKVTFKGEKDFFGECVKEIDDIKLIKELDVIIGKKEYLQYSLFLN